MRFIVEADPLGPLNVLDELPDFRLAILEGLNGIGKTLTVRLLQLCTGTMPYSVESSAWLSLCAGLGPFRIEATGLANRRTIEWIGDSRDWQSATVNESSPPRFRQIRIDGRDANLDEVRSVIAVHRIAGDETLIETLAQQADAAGQTVRRWAHRHADQNSGPLVDMEIVASRALGMLGTWTLDSYRKQAALFQDCRVEAQSAAKLADEAERRREELSSAAEIANTLAEMRRRAPDLSLRLKEVDQQIAAVEGERLAIQRKVQALAGQVAAARPLVRELQNARRTLDRNRENLSVERNGAAAVAARLGIGEDQDEVEAHGARLSAEIDALERQRSELDTAPLMRDLLDDILRQLGDGERHGLGDQIALEDALTELQLTVSQTRGGMGVRRDFLEGKPPPPETQELDERLEAARQALRHVDQLRAFLSAAERYRRLVAHNEDRVRVALATINPNAVRQMESLEVQRRENDDRLLDLAAERAALRQQLGTGGDGITQEALAVQLSRALEQLGVEEEGLQAALSRAEDAFRRAQLNRQRLQERVAELRSELARGVIEIRRARDNLQSAEALLWLRRAFDSEGVELRLDANTPQDQLASLDAARSVATSIVDRLGDVRGQLGAVESALNGVARHLRGQDPQAVRYFPEVQRGVSRLFSEWFNGSVRQELLPNATGDATVNVGTREIVWRDGEVTLARPLEAFSSGEQAFAYTKARLAMLDDDAGKHQNRLIVLDEFGAFIAHDRLAGLLAYLQDRAKRFLGDQVLVILPLSRDYADLATSGYGDEAERYATLAAQVQSRQYAVRPLAQ